MDKKIISTDKAPKAIGPYVQGTIFENTLYVSGQLGIDMNTGELAADVRAQALNSLKNMEQILLEAKSDKSKVLKCVIYMTNMDDFSLVNEIYADFFGDKYPARSCVAVKELPKKAQVEIECIAHI